MTDILPIGTDLYPLANAKDTDLLCELCQKPAFLQCSQCRVTYYCSVEHQRADWTGIHSKICEDLIPLRCPLPFLTSEDHRKKRQEEMIEKQTEMINLTRTIGQKLLFEGKSEEAVPAALQSLKFAIAVHGLASVELVPSYLILGEASIGLNRLPQAEEYLSQAQWTVLKTPNCSHAIKSKLYRNLGLLFTAKGNYDSALESLAHDVFHSAEEFGTDDIRTSGAYFQMANIFFDQQRAEIYEGLYRRVTDIWMEHLHKIVLILITPPEIPEGIGEVVAEITHEEKEHLDEAQQAEAVKILNAIFYIRCETGNGSEEQKAKISYSLQMLYFILDDRQKTSHFGEIGLSFCEGSETEDILNDISNLLTFVDN